MNDKKLQRLRRARRGRAKVSSLGAYRLSVHRTPRHIYAQVFAPGGGEVVACASTLEALIKKGLSVTGNIDAATAVGKAIAEKAQAKGITRVAFDRAGYKYHGRIKALAEAARTHGLEF